MKKITSILFATLLILVLAACGGADDTSSKEDNTKDEPTQEQEDGKETSGDTKDDEEADKEMTAEEVYKKSAEANNELNSFSVKMDMDQKMDLGEDGAIDSIINIDMDAIQDPFTMKQVMTMDMGELGKEEAEMYLTEDGFFMYDSSLEQWLKFPEELTEELLVGLDQADINDQLNQLDEFSEDFTLEETDDRYILSLEAVGEEFNKLMNAAIEDALGANLEVENKDAFGEIEFETIKYKIALDKETFLIQEMDVDMLFHTKDVEDTMDLTFDQTLHAVYSNHNEIDKIEVPKEALENAEEVEF